MKGSAARVVQRRRKQLERLLSHAPRLSVGLSNAYFESLGLPSFVDEDRYHSRTAVYGPVRTVVWQGSVGDHRPYADQRPL